jgi:hypothetical protein
VAGRRPTLGALFLVLSIALIGVAAAAAEAARNEPGLWVVVLAAGAIALWLGSLAYRALKG